MAAVASASAAAVAGVVPFVPSSFLTIPLATVNDLMRSERITKSCKCCFSYSLFFSSFSFSSSSKTNFVLVRVLFCPMGYEFDLT